MKVKYIINAAMIGFIIVLAISRQLEHNGRLREKATRIRVEDNQAMLIKQDSLKYVKLELKLDEFINAITPKVDAILKEEKIKPKNVTNVIERHFIYRDTSFSTYSPAPVNTINGIVFPFRDHKNCMLVEGFVRIDSLQPIVTITNREFENNSIDIAYVKREKKFMGIRYGRWIGDLKSKSDCGEEKTKEIKVIKTKN